MVIISNRHLVHSATRKIFLCIVMKMRTHIYPHVTVIRNNYELRKVVECRA